MTQPVLDRLDAVSELIARNVLKELLVHDVQNARRAASILDKIDQAGEHMTRKRKADSEAHICVKCKDVFLESDNEKTACHFHDGELDPDFEHDFWADHDEDCHGEIDCPEMREEYPEGFEWSCCQKLGNSEGCKVGKHRAVNLKRGGTMYWQKYPDSEEGGDEEGDEEEDEENDEQEDEEDDDDDAEGGEEDDEGEEEDDDEDDDCDE